MYYAFLCRGRYGMMVGKDSGVEYHTCWQVKIVGYLAWRSLLKYRYGVC